MFHRSDRQGAGRFLHLGFFQTGHTPRFSASVDGTLVSSGGSTVQVTQLGAAPSLLSRVLSKISSITQQE